MESQSINQPQQLDVETTVVSLTERHLQQWFQLLDNMRDSHAPTDQLAFCQSQITQLQRDLHQLRSS